MSDTALRTAPVAIDIRDATVAFGRKRVLDRLSLAVETGVIVGLVGPNGVGKTTLLRLIAGLIHGSERCVHLSDPYNRTTGRQPRKNVFFIEDAGVLDLKLTGMDYLRYVKALWRSAEALDEVVASLDVGLFVKKPLRKLSQGMRQQIILALALVSGAPIILLDEPMNSLDPTNTDKFSQQLIKRKEQGATILLSTHLLSNIDDLADRIVFLRDGRVETVKEQGEGLASLELYRELYPHPFAGKGGSVC